MSHAINEGKGLYCEDNYEAEYIGIPQREPCPYMDEKAYVNKVIVLWSNDNSIIYEVAGDSGRVHKEIHFSDERKTHTFPEES